MAGSDLSFLDRDHGLGFNRTFTPQKVVRSLMKRVVRLILIVLSAGTTASAAPQTSDRASIERTLIQIEQDWMRASVAGDVEFYRRTLSNEFVHTADGLVADKIRYIEEAMASGALVMGSGVSDDIKVVVLGPDAAVVTGHDVYTNARDSRGEDVSGEYRWTDTFARRNGQWVCVASHESKVPSNATAADEQLIGALESEWIDAEVKHDVAVLDRVLDDRFFLVDTAGRITVGKPAFLDAVRRMTFTSVRVVREHLEVQGDTALVVDTFITRQADGTNNAPVRGTVTYHKRLGQWRAVGEQLGRIAAEP
jgi:ketosteroid isomerase-like protein